MWRTAVAVCLGLVLFVLLAAAVSPLFWREQCRANGGSVVVMEDGRSFCMYLYRR